ncbi:hypothetical protein LguiA_030370 [Lonicera macranthoides]
MDMSRSVFSNFLDATQLMPISVGTTTLRYWQGPIDPSVKVVQVEAITSSWAARLAIEAGF